MAIGVITVTACSFLIHKNPTGLILVLWLPSLVGVARLTNGDAWQTSYILLLAPLAFAAGSTALNLDTFTRWPRRGERARSSASEIGWQLAVICVCALTVVHFVRAGVPILGGNVEVARFTSLGTSGFGGIPSRAYLFGLPTLASVAALHSRHLSRWSVLLILSTFIASRILGGFKSGLLEAAVVLILPLMLTAHSVGRRVARATFWLGGSAVAYAFVVAGQYATVTGAGGVSGAYVWERLTLGSATAAVTALNIDTSWLWQGTPFGHDLIYFLGKYLHVGPSPQFAFDQVASAAISHTPLSARSFLVPVTVGGAAYAFLSTGRSWLITLSLFVLLGLLWRLLMRQAQESPSLIAAACAFAGLHAMRMYVSNGGAAYLIVNFGVALCLIVVVMKTGNAYAEIASRGKRPRRDGALLVAARAGKPNSTRIRSLRAEATAIGLGVSRTSQLRR